MNLSDIADTARQISGGMSETAQILGRAYSSCLLFPLSPGPSKRRLRLRSTIWNMRRLLREALGEGVDKELMAALNTLARKGDEIQRAVVVWIDLFEVLVQNAEQRFGSSPGRGAIKASEVKAVFRYLLRAGRFDIPQVPKFLEPIIIDVFVDWSVDAVVLILNDYSLWVDTEPSPSQFRSFIIVLWHRTHRLLRPLWLFLAWLGSRIWQILRVRRPLSPELRAALEAVEREGIIVQQKELLRGTIDLLSWIGTRRKQLIAAFELVFAAVQEAEGYLSFSGPEKKTYARDLVLAVLDDMGFVQRTGLLFAIIDSTVNGAIEAAVHLFNKRGAFTH